MSGSGDLRKAFTNGVLLFSFSCEVRIHDLSFTCTRKKYQGDKVTSGAVQGLKFSPV